MLVTVLYSEAAGSNSVPYEQPLKHQNCMNSQEPQLHNQGQGGTNKSLPVSPIHQ